MDDLYRRIVDNLPSMVWSARTDLAKGRFEWLYVSDRMLKWLNLSRDAVNANPAVMNDTIHPDDRGSYEAAVMRASEHLEPLDWLGRSIGPNGETRWVHMGARLERDADGSLVWFGESSDRTEHQSAVEALRTSEHERRRNERLMRTVLDALPVGVSVMDHQGRFVLFNEATRKATNQDAVDGKETISDNYGVYEPDGSAKLPSEVLPIVRALSGEAVSNFEMLLKGAATPEGALLNVSSTPLCDDDGKVWAALAVANDITEQRALEVEIQRRNKELVASEEAKTALIERLRYAIDELSTPVLEVWDDVLVTPVIGVIDSRRMADMVQKLLSEIVRTQAQFVIVDLTGVDLVDTKTADHLIKMVRKAELIGARCMLTGIQPAVAQTLVDIGVDFGRLTTLRNLKHGLRESMRVRARTGEIRAQTDATGRERVDA